jgi:pyridinium-3,5-biscarboxylic acid mononucleotide sulfurtransferase
VDSTLLAKIAVEVLGDKILLATAVSPTYTPSELEQARILAKEFGARFREIKTAECENPSFLENPPDRCYICKGELFRDLEMIRFKEGLPWLFDGSNADDTADYRPGRRAAIEYSVRSPLREAGLTKAEIREVSRALGLPTWNQPARACLASRFPYGIRLEADAMQRVARAEEFLYSLGFSLVRVRHHGDIARIEVPEEEINLLANPETRIKVSSALRDAGYTYITLDLRGYRTGSMNETLSEEIKKKHTDNA